MQCPEDVCARRVQLRCSLGLEVRARTEISSDIDDQV